MRALHTADVRWGAALFEQNLDEVVRCDRCDQQAFAPACRRGPRLDRAGWPELRCVFRASCRGHMRREWLN